MTYKPPAKKPFEYGELITNSFRLVWRHKFLWFFGLFAGSGSSLGGWNCNYSTSGSDGDSIPVEVTDWIDAHLVLVISIIAAVVVVALILWLWSIVCQGAVIKSVRDIRLGHPSDFGSSFRNGTGSFGRLLLFFLFLMLLVVGMMIIVGAVILFFVFLAAAGEAGSIVASITGSVLGFMAAGVLMASFGYLFACTAWIVGPLLLTLWLTFAIRAVLIEDLRPVAALKQGGRVLMDNLSRSLLLFLLSIGLSIGAGIAILIATFVAGIPAIIAWIVTYNVDFSVIWVIIASALVVPAAAVMIVAAALNNSYFTTYWTDIYLMFTGVIEDTKGESSKGPEPAVPPVPPSVSPVPR